MKTKVQDKAIRATPCGGFWACIDFVKGSGIQDGIRATLLHNVGSPVREHMCDFMLCYPQGVWIQGGYASPALQRQIEGNMLLQLPYLGVVASP